jgi:GMP synthase (glutamine-hydrolysing)
MSILVFQHGAHVGPVRLGRILRDHACTLDIRRLDLMSSRPGDPRWRVPADFDGIDAVVSLGGEQNVGEDHPWMQAQIEYLREAHARQLPLVGICLGCQLIAHALGGKVGPMDQPELGFTAVTQHPIANTETILAGIPWSMPQFQAHGHEVKELPAGATLLQSSAACNVQSYRVGLRTYAFQYHFEFDRAAIDSIAGDGARSSEFDEFFPTFDRLSDRLCLNLAMYLFPIGRPAHAVAVY